MLSKRKLGSVMRFSAWRNGLIAVSVLNFALAAGLRTAG